jgi:DNA-binding NtrC family response regulator
MNIRPRVLVIDDLLGKERLEEIDRQNRADYCRSLGLRDEAVQTEPSYAVIADAFISGGQRSTPAGMVNDLGLVERDLLAGWPQRVSVTVGEAQDSVPARAVLCSRYWSAVITDMKFGDDSHFGLCVIEHIHRLAPELPIIVVSSLNQLALRSGETLRHAAERLGAQDFLAVSGVDFDVEPAYRSTPQNMQNRLDALGLVPDPEQQVVGVSLATCRMLKEVRTLIPQDAVGQTLLLGETGSGKSHLLGYIHRQVARVQHRPLTGVRCQQVTLTGTGEDMQRKALFGTTDATGVKSTSGAFEDVRDGGLLFLDEIGELTPTSQSDLLGALQPLLDKDGTRYRDVKRMGAREGIKSRCFVLAATNRDLSVMVNQAHFNEALIQRFANKHVQVPPLRVRKQDLPLLIERFVQNACRQYGIATLPKLEVRENTWEQYADTHAVRQLAALIEETISRNPFKTLLTETDFWGCDGDLDASPLRPQAVSGGNIEQKLDTKNPERAETVSSLIRDLNGWTPNVVMDSIEFEGAFHRLDTALANAKLRLWRHLVERQKNLIGGINLLATARQLLGRPQIVNSKSGDLAAQIFADAGQTERPSDPILAEIWDRRRVSKRAKSSGDDSAEVR